MHDQRWQVIYGINTKFEGAGPARFYNKCAGLRPKSATDGCIASVVQIAEDRETKFVTRSRERSRAYLPLFHTLSYNSVMGWP